MEGKGKGILGGIIVVVLVCLLINQCNSGNNTEKLPDTSVPVQSSSSQISKEPLTKEEQQTLAENESKAGVLRGFLTRFTVYAASNGIELNQFNKKNELNTYFTDLIASAEKIDRNAYYLFTDSALLQEDFFVVSNLVCESQYTESNSFYIGEVNSKNRPDGRGMIGILRNERFDGENPIRIITYIGEFKDGRKNGYGIQFYIPDETYIPAFVERKVDELLSKDGINRASENYNEKFREYYNLLYKGMVNIPIYEGEFKNNRFSGKGNYSSPYVANVDEFAYGTADDSEDDRRIDAEIFYNYFEKKDAFMMDVGLYVGTFDKNKPVKANCYEHGKLVHDGKWRDFKEPVG